LPLPHGTRNHDISPACTPVMVTAFRTSAVNLAGLDYGPRGSGLENSLALMFVLGLRLEISGVPGHFGPKRRFGAQTHAA
jgi:hypothetical protein